jgi:hypothetical protein
MTSSDAVRIASRAIALYLFLVSATSAIGLLSSAASLVQAINFSSQISTPSRVLNGSLMALASAILRITLNVAIGLWLYRCGPQIYRFFSISEAQ